MKGDMAGGVQPCAEAVPSRPWPAPHRTTMRQARSRPRHRRRGAQPARAVQSPRLPASAPSGRAPGGAPRVCPCGLISGCLSRSALPEQTAAPATRMRLVAAPERGNCSDCHSRESFWRIREIIMGASAAVSGRPATISCKRNMRSTGAIRLRRAATCRTSVVRLAPTPSTAAPSSQQRRSSRQAACPVRAQGSEHGDHDAQSPAQLVIRLI